ncbi:MAG: Uncharacterized protein G01um101431_436 [Parcubacteria group bacterium Gr01-1014_31]|nr:MAG: Uncharacterized protein G01um101431_436 [Parcubacteria group bacterium Gr01-1014_31]
MESKTPLRASFGFTFIELLVVLGLMVTLAALAVPLFFNWQSQSGLDTVAQELAAVVREAQARAMAGDGASAWGVHFDDAASDRFVLFRGASFATRDAAYDQVTVLPPSVAYDAILVAGGDAVVFSRGRGTTGNIGSVTLRSSEGKTFELRVNAAGAVNAP